MRAVLQRVTQASVTVDGKVVSEIQSGLLILLGVEDADGMDDVLWLASKVANLRIFGDAQGVMNLSVKDCQGDCIVVSQFTLHAMIKKGNRPSYIKAARPEQAIPLYEAFVLAMERELGKKVGTGIFGADMKVALRNDGPVTIFIDTQNKF